MCVILTEGKSGLAENDSCLSRITFGGEAWLQAQCHSLYHQHICRIYDAIGGNYPRGIIPGQLSRGNSTGQQYISV